MTFRTACALAFFLTLSACQADAPAPGDPDSGASAGQTLPDTATVRAVSPETTERFLAGGLDAASPSVAIQTIDLWIARIDSTSVEGVEEGEALRQISADLETLRNLLQSSPLDGPAIGRTLGTLGEETGGLAAPGTGLDALARTLRSHGARLAPEPTTGEVDSTETAL